MIWVKGSSFVNAEKGCWVRTVNGVWDSNLAQLTFVSCFLGQGGKNTRNIFAPPTITLKNNASRFELEPSANSDQKVDL